ncbi:MAG: preprotein translocase subunit SecE [Clostridia bacterium]|nr:preprotein translocase subunit SecE [Clostridia bacterium]
MSEKKAVAKGKNRKPSLFVRFGRGFIRFFARIGNAFRNTWRELKKVTWPTRDKLINYSIIVMLFMVFMMIIIGLLDTGATTLVQLIMG